MTDQYHTDETLTEQQREVQKALQNMRDMERQRADAADAEPVASVQRTGELQ